MKKLAALLTLILWSISTAASASSAMTVMCVEKSGAIAFEYSFGTRCADKEEANASTAAFKSAVSNQACASCTDSSLSSPTATTAVRIAAKALAEIPTLPPTAAVPETVLVHVNGLRAPPKSAPAVVRSAYLAQRETIVILQ